MIRSHIDKAILRASNLDLALKNWPERSRAICHRHRCLTAAI